MSDVQKLICGGLGYLFYLVAIITSFVNSYLILCLISATTIMWMLFAGSIVFMILGAILIGTSQAA